MSLHFKAGATSRIQDALAKTPPRRRLAGCLSLQRGWRQNKSPERIASLLDPDFVPSSNSASAGECFRVNAFQSTVSSQYFGQPTESDPKIGSIHPHCAAGLCPPEA